MDIFLIDYENTNSLNGIGDLSDEDRVIIFYSEKADKITFDIHLDILSSKAKIEYKRVEVGGKNALDFQLCSYLGYLIKLNEGIETNYYIISNDNGYSFMKTFWEKEASISIKIQKELINNAITMQKQIAPDDEISTALQQLENPLTESEIEEIKKIVLKYKTAQTVNGNLNKLFKDSTRAGSVFKIVKPFIKKNK